MTQLSGDLYNNGPQNKKYCFAGFPSTMIYKASKGKKWYNHLLFGDYIKILNTNIINGRIYARSRNSNGWVNISDIQKDRVLEVNFVDIGQGDGCHVVTPDDKHFIIDAGKTDNMVRYLSWRFNLVGKKKPLYFPITLVISHSDTDHYQGFGYVFDNDKIKIDKIYHNGLVERPGANPLGKIENDLVTEIITDTNQMMGLIMEENNRKGPRSTYCKTLFKALKYNPIVDFKALSIKNNYLEGFGNDNTIISKKFSIKVLAPIPTRINGKEGLKSIKNLGKDKNGHSVILKIIFDNAKILLGGDVNEEFGKIILEHYKNKNQVKDLRVDVSKACHHGSNHFHYGFIEAINANATVISSGDDESYSHPRPDTIGALGKCGYGKKPLIFSTELARSNKEFTYEKFNVISKLITAIGKIDTEIENETDSEVTKKLKLKKSKKERELNSFLTKYGMINLRTDGKRMIIAQKYEKKASYGKWDIHELEYSKKKERFELK